VARRFYPLVEITLFESVKGLLGCTAIVSRALFLKLIEASIP
jgi:hypothetical protein